VKNDQYPKLIKKFIYLVHDGLKIIYTLS